MIMFMLMIISNQDQEIKKKQKIISRSSIL